MIDSFSASEPEQPAAEPEAPDTDRITSSETAALLGCKVDDLALLRFVGFPTTPYLVAGRRGLRASFYSRSQVVNWRSSFLAAARVVK